MEKNFVPRANNMRKTANQRRHVWGAFRDLALTIGKQKRPSENHPVKSPLRYPGGKSRAIL